MTVGDQAHIRDLVEKEAETRKNNAAYSGEMTDRGAGALLLELETWLCGLRGEVPPRWEKLESWKKVDPDYATYLELKKRFEP